MGFGKRLRIQRSADGRVLKSQLDMTAEALRATRISAPAWCLFIAVLASNQVGLIGHMPLLTTLIAPALLGMTMVALDKVVGRYRRDTSGAGGEERTQLWFGRFVMMQAVVSVAWGLMPWLLWDRGDSLNHVFLAASTISILAGLVVSRASHMDMFLASLIPFTAMASLRFAFGGTALEYGTAVVIPLVAVQLFLDGRRMMHRLDEDSRLRFQVEDLARELEETRDDALRKRFEAETANASKTAFLANMSHELRTPLNAILGFSEIIAQECFGPTGSPRYKEYAGDIHTSGAHLLSLINDLLDVAKIEAGKMEIEPQPLDAHRTFDIALKLISAKAREKHQDLTIAVDASAPPLFADERALKQILINLVSNAVKFTPEGGRIQVVGSAARGGGFQISVQDNGPGIPREKLDRIFTPFSQVDNRYDRQAGGTGLGLALIRGLAELHGGRAWLESEPGKGCCAYVVLPLEGERRKLDAAAA